MKKEDYIYRAMVDLVLEIVYSRMIHVENQGVTILCGLASGIPSISQRVKKPRPSQSGFKVNNLFIYLLINLFMI
jgi:hypothetical protein